MVRGRGVRSPRSRGVGGARVQQRVDQLARQFRLSKAEADLVEAVVSRVTREQYMNEQDITDNTYKTHVRHILKKTGKKTLADVREEVMVLTAKRMRK